MQQKLTHARNRPTSWWLSGQVPTWLLMLVLVVSVAGILLPRRTDRTAELLAKMASLQQAVGNNAEAHEGLTAFEGDGEGRSDYCRVKFRV